ncbi:hypothetical protein VKT23_018652 [Stygiomarasmius scandens]|uniref:SMODS and SLOG-associating 2TM effector domain-containing protein n=1 Tax=Marasmiellus scandens TaxID=2682957 RepID=A0ABR1INS3_9AGAR
MSTNPLPRPISEVLQKLKNQYSLWNYLCDVWPQALFRSVVSTIQALGVALFTEIFFTASASNFTNNNLRWAKTAIFGLLVVLVLALGGDGLIAGYQTYCMERLNLVHKCNKRVEAVVHLECRLKTAAQSVTTTRFASRTGSARLTEPGMREEACLYLLWGLRREFESQTPHIDWNSLQRTVVSKKTLQDVIWILDDLHLEYNRKRELVEGYDTVDVADVL